MSAASTSDENSDCSGCLAIVRISAAGACDQSASVRSSRPDSTQATGGRVSIYRAIDDRIERPQFRGDLRVNPPQIFKPADFVEASARAVGQSLHTRARRTVNRRLHRLKERQTLGIARRQRKRINRDTLAISRPQHGVERSARLWFDGSEGFLVSVRWLKALSSFFICVSRPSVKTTMALRL